MIVVNNKRFYWFVLYIANFVLFQFLIVIHDERCITIIPFVVIFYFIFFLGGGGGGGGGAYYMNFTVYTLQYLFWLV